MQSLMSMTQPELEALMARWGQPRFRAAQIGEWLRRSAKPHQMHTLPKALRQQLETVPWGGARIDERRVSQKDGTVKYLFALDDDNLVEGVLMRYHYGNTLCMSTQVGCRMGCAFCASTLEGCVRNLDTGELLGELYAAEQDAPNEEGHERSITNIVLMGSGEPLDNYDNVLAFLRRITDPQGLRISPRNISLSTCGLVPQLLQFMHEAPPVTLSVSLHAHDDETRSRLMPVNKTYPVSEVVAAAGEYARVTRRRVIFEYALIDGVNASKEDAQALAKLLRGMLCHVNLIPLNPVPERNLKGATRAQAAQFAAWLTDCHISATVRREMGTDIQGACGQLRRSVLQKRSEQ